MTRRSSVVLVIIASISLAAFGSIVGSAATQNLEGSGTVEDPYEITNVEELQAINDDLDAHYVLANDIEASDFGRTFTPIGETENYFNGTLDGKGHTIRGLHIREFDDNIAFISLLGGTVKNVHFEEITVDAKGRVSGRAAIVVAYNVGDIHRVSATGEVTTEPRGGLRGSASRVAGIVGEQATEGASITESWSDVDVDTPSTMAGGIVGRSYANVEDSYTLGRVNGEHAGGLMGINEGEIQSSVSRAAVGGSDLVGGIAERNHGRITEAYWNLDTSGQSQAVGEGFEEGTGLTTSEMTGEAAARNMDGLDFDETWTLTDNYPILRWQVEHLDATKGDEIIQVGNTTDVFATLDLIGERTEPVTTVASYESRNASVASIADGSVTAKSPSEVKLTVTHAGQEATTSVLVIANEGISAIDAEIDSTDVTAGDTVTVTGTFRNVDENATYHHADLLINGEAVTSENVTVKGDSDETHTFEWTAESAGTYDLSIDGVDASSVDVSPKSTTQQPADDSTGENADESSNDETGDNAQSGQSGSDDDGSDGLPVVPLAIGSAVVAAGGVVLGRRL